MHLLRSVAVVALLAIVGCGDRNTTTIDDAPTSAAPNPIEKTTMPSKKPPKDQRPANDDELREKQWNEVYQSRERFYEENFGKLPPDILKMANLFGVWPGGGLYVFQAPKLNNLWVYTSFGLTNFDLPSGVGVDNHQVETDEQGRLAKSSSRLVKKDTPPPTLGRPGYGYELLVLTRQKEDWPLGLLQWGVNAEILNDVGILDRVRKYKGLTIEQVNVGDGDPVNVLIAEAQPPIPAKHLLPNGSMTLLVMTAITDDEMQWSLTNGRDALLQRLMKSRVGQVSERSRRSVIAASGKAEERK